MIIIGKLEKFMGGPTPSTYDRLHVTINRAGLIRLNDNCYRLLGRPPAFYLYYSKEDNVIALEPVHSASAPAAFPVKTTTSGWRIQAAPLCKHYGIRIETTERFVNPEITRDGPRLLLDLTETTTVRQVRLNKRPHQPPGLADRQLAIGPR
ncbi:MAG: hypothetical protein IPM25_16175 [Chloracidobacterium sp.]|nr:hypothetical protein [Chloracidobacterium sp.]